MDSEIKDLTARIESLNKKMGAPAYLTKVSCVHIVFIDLFL